MRNEVIEGLKSARVLLENGWTTGKTARNSRGEGVSVYDPTACSFCVLGAVWRVGGYVAPLGGDMEELVRRVIRARVPLGNHAPGTYNEAWNKTCGFACRSWAVTAQANAQRNCAIPTGDDQERETVGQIEETWVGESVYNRVRMGGKGGAVVSD